MKTKEKPHDPGRDQRLKMLSNRARLNKGSIPIFNRSINRKARSEAVKLPGGRPRNAHLFITEIRLLPVYSALSSMSKDTGRAES